MSGEEKKDAAKKAAGATRSRRKKEAEPEPEQEPATEAVDEA